MERENKGESGGNRDKDKERQAARGPETSPKKLPKLLIPSQSLILTLLRVPTHSLLLIPSRKYL